MRIIHTTPNPDGSTNTISTELILDPINASLVRILNSHIYKVDMKSKTSIDDLHRLTRLSNDSFIALAELQERIKEKHLC